jgi:hypothetical protein
MDTKNIFLLLQPFQHLQIFIHIAIINYYL